MSDRLEEIARRKQVLIEKAAQERAEIASAYNKFRAPFEIGTMLLGVARALKAHPLIAAGVSSFLVSGLGKKLFKLSGELLKLWRVLVPIRTWWRKRRRAS